MYIWDPIVNVRNPINLKLNIVSPNLLKLVTGLIGLQDGVFMTPNITIFSSGVEPINEYTYTKSSQKKLQSGHNYEFDLYVQNETYVNNLYITLRVLPPAFVRGDVNHDGAIDIADPVAIINYLFQGGTIDCLDAADINDGGNVDLTDAIQLMNYMFLDVSQEPSAPFLQCGEDLTPDNLSCNFTVVCPVQ